MGLANFNKIPSVETIRDVPARYAAVFILARLNDDRKSKHTPGSVERHKPLGTLLEREGIVTKVDRVLQAARRSNEHWTLELVTVYAIQPDGLAVKIALRNKCRICHVDRSGVCHKKKDLRRERTRAYVLIRIRRGYMNRSALCLILNYGIVFMHRPAGFEVPGVYPKLLIRRRRDIHRFA